MKRPPVGAGPKAVKSYEQQCEEIIAAHPRIPIRGTFLSIAYRRRPGGWRWVLQGDYGDMCDITPKAGEAIKTAIDECLRRIADEAR